MKIGTLGLCLLIILAGALQAEAILQGGFARINITPDKPVTLSGYASRKALSTGVHETSPFAPSAADNVVKRALMHLHRL